MHLAGLTKNQRSQPRVSYRTTRIKCLKSHEGPHIHSPAPRSKTQHTYSPTPVPPFPLPLGKKKSTKLPRSLGTDTIDGGVDPLQGEGDDGHDDGTGGEEGEALRIVQQREERVRVEAIVAEAPLDPEPVEESDGGGEGAGG